MPDVILQHDGIESAARSTSTDELTQHGRKEYGLAWLKTGEWIAENALLLRNIGPVAFGFIMIHQKCMRGLAADATNDHYRDILGYMSLILHELELQASARKL